MPKGPGSIEGLGESFQPTLNTGTAKYSVALKVPPGTAGQTPELHLAYEGGAGNGPLGFGWVLPTTYIQRRADKGIPLYEGDQPPTISDDWSARYTTFINEMKEELVPQTNGYFFCKNEGVFIRYESVGDHWVGTMPDGTRLEFGLSESGRIQSETNRVFCWLLERETDTRGNTILYSYTNFSGIQNTNQKYLSGISYGPGSPPWNNFHFVTFSYEDRPDWFEDCRAGFVVRTGKRLRRIIIGTQGPTLSGHLQVDFNSDGIPDNLDRIYELGYLNYAGTNTHWSLLARITPIGADGTSSLPVSSFGYNVCNPPDSLPVADNVIVGLSEPPAVMDNTNVDLVDLNGDGLPDILRTFPGGAPQEGSVNLGEVEISGVRYIRWTNGITMGGDERASSYYLSAPEIHLADMDGDGLADLVVNSGGTAGTVYYFTNLAGLQWGTRRAMATNDSTPPSPFGNADVRTADLDFDKRIDIIESVSSGGSVDYRVWFNLGNNSYSARKTQSNSLGFLFSSPGVQIADFNGDRVPDIVQVRQDGVVVTAGLGYGRFADTVFVTIPEGLDYSQVAQAKLQDITGDGLADLVLERASPGVLYYWINLGNYTFSSRKVVTGMPTALSASTVVRWADMNGNGTTDLIYADSSSTPKLRTVDIGELLNCAGSPNILTAISNGIGRVTLIGYASSTKFALDDAAAGHAWTNVMPNPVIVVASVTNLDSLGDQYVTEFRYHDGYYDPGEKQFRGFARVEQVDRGDATAPTLVTRSVFDTGRYFESMKGRLLRLTAEQEDGRIFWDEATSWTIPPVTLYTGTNGTNVSYAHPLGHVKTIKELGQGAERRLESEFAYDNYGNQVTNADYGIVNNGDRSAFDDERITVTQYALNLDAWIIRHPVRQEIQDENGVVISRVDSFYDDETFSANNFGQVTIGNLTLRREWIDSSNPTGFVKAARSKYDLYGNPITLFDPLADAADSTKGHYRDLVYNDRFHTYPVREIIYLGGGKEPLVFQAQYDEGFGTVTSSFDFNTNQTTYGYDIFGRLITVVKPYDTSNYPTLEYDYAFAVPTDSNGMINYVETRQLDKTPGTLGADKRDYYFISRQFVDGLGRKLMTKTEAEPAPGSATPRIVVSGATLFNQRQRPSITLNSYFSLQPGNSLDELLAFEDIRADGWQGQFQDNGPLVNLGLSTAHKSSIEYDATLREIRHANPDGTQRTNRYEPLVQWSYDENDTDPTSQYANTPMVHHNDGLGRLVRVDEITRLNDEGTPAASIKVWTTRYEYNLNDQLMRITDSQNNVKTMAYDGLKRKIFMDDPDRGHMTYVYDDASNLIETTDAKNQRITYTYDAVNRILTEDYHDEGLPFSANKIYDPARPVNEVNRPDVAYFYDVPEMNLPQGDNTTATARNTRGALAYVWDLSGEEHTSYDARGRVEYVVKRIPDPVFWTNRAMAISPLWLVSYRTGFEYDSLDRIAHLTYPDLDRVTYQYNERNLLKRIPGGPSGSIISNIVYQPSGQQAVIDYGNRVRTTYDYDNRLRLKKLLTFRTQPSTDDLQLINFAYDFDGASNIKAIYDNRPGTAVPTGDQRRNTQIFGYDDLYRLTRVQYSFNLPVQSLRNDGVITYRYDRIGNMLSQTSDIQHFENGVSVTQLGDMSYGGALGRSGRVGRSPNDPPGPHALTAVSQPSTNNLGSRVYPYDPNGNMADIDGLVCTWDFRDRLVAVESGQTRGEYTYDYSNRRISKHVTQQDSSTHGGGAIRNSVREPLNTIYVNTHFEVRDHDAATKYVWWGNTRVARVTGSLVSAARVQRLRTFPGWNLISSAVVLTNGSAQLGIGSNQQVRSAYVWRVEATNFFPISTSEALSAGSILWLDCASAADLSLTGAYLEQTNIYILPGGNYYASGLGIAVLERPSLPNLTVWQYGQTSKQWQLRSFGMECQSAQEPIVIAPGSAIFIETPILEPAALRSGNPALTYFHQDHLSSVSVVSDESGLQIQENAFYPFGFARKQNWVTAVSEPYAFIQRERDEESELQYLEARFFACQIAHFLRADALDAYLSSHWISDPQMLNLYSYCANRPINQCDPSGLDPNNGEILVKGGGAFAEASLETLAHGLEKASSAAQLAKILSKGTGPLVVVGEFAHAYHHEGAGAAAQEFGISGGAYIIGAAIGGPVGVGVGAGIKFFAKPVLGGLLEWGLESTRPSANEEFASGYPITTFNRERQERLQRRTEAINEMNREMASALSDIEGYQALEKNTLEREGKTVDIKQLRQKWDAVLVRELQEIRSRTYESLGKNDVSGYDSYGRTAR